MDEKKLALMITDFLNKTSLYDFKFIDNFCDIADERNRIFIEVKPDHFAYAQILHAVARRNIKDAKYLGVADNKTVKLYLPPHLRRC